MDFIGHSTAEMFNMLNSSKQIFTSHHDSVFLAVVFSLAFKISTNSASDNGVATDGCIGDGGSKHELAIGKSSVGSVGANESSSQEHPPSGKTNPISD